MTQMRLRLQPSILAMLLMAVALLVSACTGTPESTAAVETDSNTEAMVPETGVEPATEGAEKTPDAAMQATPESAGEEPGAEANEAQRAGNEALPDLSGQELVVYSGRNEELVGPIIKRFEEETGATVKVRYGDTAEMAATILEEGPNSPADVYYGQDAGALGALAKEGRLAPLPEDILSSVEPRFRSPEGQWIGTSGRARVVVYNTEMVSEEDLPESILDFTDPKWKGRIGWAPTNGSFQSFVTALRVEQGEEAAREWLRGIQANEPKVYKNNTAVLEAVAAGEVDAGFVNHYYLFRKLEEQGESFPARNYFFPDGDIGGLINVAGVGIVDTSDKQEVAEAFVRFLLSEEAQRYFSDTTKEYPLIEGVSADPMLPSLEEIQTPEIDLTELDDLEGTLELLQEEGIL